MEGVFTFSSQPLQSALTGGQTTPPPIQQEDPDMPRKGNKWMAKDADAWIPMLKELEKHIARNKICLACWKTGHEHYNCPVKGGFSVADYRQAFRHPNFGPYLESWKETRRKKGIAWKVPTVQNIDAETVVVSTFCDQCLCF